MDSVIDFRLENPYTATQFGFRHDQGQTPAVDLRRFTSLSADERVAGLSLGAIGIPFEFQGEVLKVEIQDARFEFRDSLVALKPGEHLNADENGGVLVEVIASNARGDLRWRESLVVEVKENLYPWHNAAKPFDTNNDGIVSAIDVLLIINRLNQDSNRQLPSVRSRIDGRDVWFDISSDGLVTPLDVLLIINHVNLAPRGEGETSWHEESDRKNRGRMAYRHGAEPPEGRGWVRARRAADGHSHSLPSSSLSSSSSDCSNCRG